MEKAMNVAKYVVTKCVRDGVPITNLQLQKILYFIQCEFLKKTREPLFAENFEAWKLGPVIPEVYYAFCGYGAMKISREYKFDAIAEEKQKLLDQKIDELRKLSASQLVSRSHEEGKAWSRVYGEHGEGLRGKITLEILKTYGC